LPVTRRRSIAEGDSFTLDRHEGETLEALNRGMILRKLLEDLLEREGL
jgi:hypothetical protein